jgi:hypothetical protein
MIDNREVLVKLNYTTKYGVQINSSRLIKNYNLYKHLVLKHIPEQVYIDFSNEDCEVVNLKQVLENASVVTDKTQIDSFNNLKSLLYKDLNTQYDLFTLIDNAYNDVFGYTVEKDLAFEKFTYFNKQFIELSKSLMHKYIQYSGTDKFPKDMNELLMFEFGKDVYDKLTELMYEPIINDTTINCLINQLLNSIDMKTNLYSKQNYNPIPLHKEHNSALSKNTNQTQPLKEKVIISKNNHGFYTFRDLVFNLQNSLVIGKWNQQTFTVDKLSEFDLNLCKIYNLKYDTNCVKTVQNVEFNQTEKTIINQIKSILSENNIQTIDSLDTDSYTDDNKTIHIVSMEEQINNQKQNIENDESKELTELTELTELDETKETEDSTENNENNENNEPLNPHVSQVIPISNDKVSKGRKRTATVINGTTSLKQKATTTRKITNK